MQAKLELVCADWAVVMCRTGWAQPSVKFSAHAHLYCLPLTTEQLTVDRESQLRC